ncbi:MAG: HAMP domain-containing histidine kinase [Clostridiales Family XIII bacterium]|jgi:signal transduction histidine kinase|nr:HAMP domain-containing histidine kinase [Clostridiales Family XIII bacterium]
MKVRSYLIAAVLIFLAGIAGLLALAKNVPDTSLDAVFVNEIVQALESDWRDISGEAYVLPKASGAVDYAVIDKDGRLIKATRRGISEDENSAALHRDTVVTLSDADGAQLGKIIFFNDSETKWRQYRTGLLIGCAAVMAAYALLGVLFVLHLRRRILSPFRTLKHFAASVAGGNLDVPLPMDRGNAFGAFSESFDLMRAELAKAREGEQRANRSKKELVAALSHDIKTPVASIKAVAELMAADTPGGTNKARLATITEKADQIDLLISNMFHATLEELQELKVTPAELSSRELAELIERADYLRLARVGVIPECLVIADPLRLSQVFDNIFSNSYKYANTGIDVTARLDGERLRLEFADYGAGVLPEELPLLTQKYFRGGNATDKSGSGIGLYISSYFMRRMAGGIECLSDGGFTVGLTLTLA